MFKKIIKLAIDNYLLIIFALVFIFSWTLALHNIPLYHYSHGFDGAGHIEYIEFVQKHWTIPPTNSSFESHQSPIYYFLAASVATVFHSIKSAQYINIFIFWIDILLVGILLHRIIKIRQAVVLGCMSLASLPMLNIFPVMYTNELLNSLFMIAGIATCYFFQSEQTNKKYFYLFLYYVCLVLGVWTKVSAVMTLPVFLISSLIVLANHQRNRVKFFIIATFLGACSIIAVIPIFWRARNSEGPSNFVRVADNSRTHPPLSFYTDISWLWKLDTSKTQYYSLSGAAWDSFWTDGQNAVTPFVEMPKKSVGLWILGFLLTPISFWGLIKFYKDKNLRGYFWTSTAVTITMMGFYVALNYFANHYSSARLTYELPIIVPYAIGIASAAKSAKWKKLLLGLLVLQFSLLFSFYWIEPWWHVTKPVDFSHLKEVQSQRQTIGESPEKN